MPNTNGHHTTAYPEEQSLSLVPEYPELREAILQSSLVTGVPAYLIRWLPLVGPAQAWFLVAMYQAHYFAAGASVCEENLGTRFKVNRNWLATWAGIGERQIAEYLKAAAQPAAGNFLPWFLEARGKRDQRRYHFQAVMPLTPMDAEAVLAWLEEAGFAADPVWGSGASGPPAPSRNH